MTVSVGAVLGQYEITARLGVGGMGEVWRARDTKLKRDVAIKVLPDAFSLDSDRLSRFQREAEVLASLNHPHIGAIYDFGNLGESRFLVLELVEGDTLADRIARGPIPLDEAFQIAKEIAEALEAAHEKGIIHRDMKPGNIKIKPDGTVKVLDFGLAKVHEAQHDGADLSNSPTLMSASTAGVIMGTASYMSPEQAKGKDADRTSDVWAFGCLLYEMLTGRRVFEGETVSEILAGVLKVEPNWRLLTAETPESIRRLLRRCLQKDQRIRLHDMADARIELEEAGHAADASDLVMQRAPQRASRLPWAIVGVLGVIAALLAIRVIVPFREQPAEAPEVHVEITTPATTSPFHFAVSPDGRRLTFVASGDGVEQLWLRPLDSVTAQPLPGTEGAQYPFWSADSRSIGFFAAGKLKRLDIRSGPPQALADVINPRGGAWSRDGVILFASNVANPLLRIQASGGQVMLATHPETPRQTGHQFPQFLPDGRHFLFYALGSEEGRGIYLGSLDSGETKRLVASDAAGSYLRPDLLVWVQQGTLVARRFDVDTGGWKGDPMTVAASVGVDGNGFAAFSLSAAGPLAYRAGGPELRQLTFFDRKGKPTGTVGDPDADSPSQPEISPDGRRVVVDRRVQNNTDVWLIDIMRRGLTRFTFDPGFDNVALWSADGMQIAFRTVRKPGTFAIYIKPANQARNEEPLLESPNNGAPVSWSRDGRFLLYTQIDPKTGFDLWVMPMTGDRRPFPLMLNTPFDEGEAEFSPDARWIVYQSNESGRQEIYVQPFPGPGGKWQISTGGGVGPRWSADGKELFFIAPDAKLMAAPVDTRGSTFEAGPAVPLFQTRIVGGGSRTLKPEYAVSLDGRFLINQPVEASTTTPIRLVLNWKPKP